MRRGQSLAPLILGLALVLPPLLNLVFELRELSTAGSSPETLAYGFGAAPEQVQPPRDQRRGRYVPARVIEFGSKEFTELVQRLARKNRQASVALGREVLLSIDGEVILVKSPARN